MDLRFTADEEAFRAEVRGWLEAHLVGAFAALRGRGGPGDEHSAIEPRRQWERTLAAAGWTCLGWPREHGGRGASLAMEMIFAEEYARAGAPGRLGHIGENLLGPTLIAFGTEEQRRRFLPPIRRAESLWCQGYSEPNAGSDLASLETRAVRDEASGQWIITGQKLWTSLAHVADWCFLLVRTDAAAPRHKGISCLLVPMRQAQGQITVRPIVQITGTSEFSEVFFDGARTDGDLVVGEVNGGWRVAMGTLAVERGASTLGQQQHFEAELREVTERAQDNGAARDPVMRQRLAHAWMGLRIMRWNALRTLAEPAGQGLSTTPVGPAMIGKLFWSEWHKALGKLAMDVLGVEGEILDGEGDGELTALQRLFLFSRADTIYAGSSEIQRNLIGERALGLPAEPRRS